MPITRTTGLPSLGERGRCRAVLGSVALHATLLIGLLAMRQSIEPSTPSTPSVILVDLVALRDAGTASGGQVEGARAVGSEAEPVAREVDAPRSSTEAADTPSTEPLPARPTDVEAAAMARRPSPTEAPTVAVAAPAEDIAEPRAAPGDEAAVAGGAPPVPDSTPADRPDLVARAEIAPRLRLDAAAPPQPAPASAAMLPEQRRMLERKLAEWAIDLAEGVDGETAWEYRGQPYTATFRRVPPGDAMGIEHVVVAVTTEQDGNRWSTEMRLKRLAFSSFAQFVDRWDSSVQIHDDEIDGRFHSNSVIYISSSRGVQPTFRGKVTTARGINTSDSTRRVRREEVFLGGLETRVRKIRLPKRFAPLPGEPAEASGRVQRFDSDTRIVFYADGSFGWQPLDSTRPEQRRALSGAPRYLLGAEDVSLHVRGIVDGKVLVYAPEDIVIEDDLVYAAPPGSGDGSDYLGLVADHNVVIAGPATTGPGDLTVHAAIFAKRRFTVRRYAAPGPATLHIVGSVAAGAVSATEPRFRTRLEFDPRLDDARPPGFPMTDRYEALASDGRWSAAPVR